MKPSCTHPAQPRLRRGDGAALLEVLLALALFVAAAAVMTVALNASMASLGRQRLAMEAADLASSVLAEVQLGIRPLAAESKRPMDPPYQDWTWEVVVTPADAAGAGEPGGLALVEVVIRHQAEPVVRRLSQALRLNTGGATNLPPATPES